ncbi:MAG TPA: hypothetical protein VKP30_07285 [Polyangiaceae bacterium]|nr:hypothetical protein [Polyangiaceae bacterium]
MVSRTLRLAFGLWLGLGVREARAEFQVAGATVDVRNPAEHASCVTEPPLRSRILDQISSTAPSPSTVQRIHVAIVNGPTGLSAELRVLGASAGVRHLEATQCAGLLEALAFTIVMILDREAASTPEQAPQTVPSAVAEGIAPTPTPPPAAPIALPSRDETTVKYPAARHAAAHGIQLPGDGELLASAGVGVGTWTSLQLETGVSFFIHDWGLGLGAFLQPGRERALGSGRIRLMTLGGSLDACRRFGHDWRLLLCVRGLLGGQRVQGQGYAEGVPNETLVTGAIGPAVGVEIGHKWVFGLHLIGLADLWRDRFFVDNGEESLKKPPATAWLVARVALSSRGVGR